MTICPNCGAELHLILPQTTASGDRKPPQTAADNGDLRIGLDLDLEPAPNGAKPQVKGQNLPYPYDFELWWKHYPMRKGKRKAAVNYRKAVQQITATTTATRTEAQAQLIAGARRYAEEVERLQLDPKSIKWAEGWLNDARWEDEAAPDTPRTEPRRPLTVAEEIERSRDD